MSARDDDEGSAEDTHRLADADTMASPIGDRPSPGGVRSDVLRAGAPLGELIILRVLGVGGMGIVYAAHDPRLDRQVAVKVLSPAAFGGDEGARSHTMREAKAMAKLSHPNVLPVYEVGRHGDQVYLVMELVHGPVLSKWLREEKPDWRRTLETLRGAGAGLAAAHAAGLVHRDFKPDNVLIGRDGRPRVVDFGLAGFRAESVSAENAAPDSELIPPSGETGLSARHTLSGALVGTPLYMAPEQLAKKRVDHRVDQFAFCVAAWEALYGQRPFGPDLADHKRGLLGEAPLVPPPSSPVPARVRAALTRGLSLDPDARHPSMDALLAELEEPARRPWLRLAAPVVALGVLAVAVLALGSPAEPCPPPSLEGVWDDELRETVAARFAASGLPFAETTLGATTAALDAYARDYSEMRVRTCRATAVRKEQSAQLLDLRMSCLERRREALAALTGALATADRAAIERAVDAASALPGIDDCADTDTLLAATPLPRDPERRERIEALRRELAVPQVLQATGHPAEALARVEPLTERAAQLGYPPLEAEALELRAVLEHEAGHNQRAARTFTEAMDRAAEGRRDDVLLRSAARRAGVLALRLGDPASAVAQRPLLESLAARSDDPELRAFTWGRMAIAIDRSGDSREAVEIQRRAVDELTRRVGTDDPRTALALNNLGAFLKNAGELDAALEAYQRSLRTNERLLGEHHPRLTYALAGIGGIHQLRGDLEEALAAQERGLAIARDSLGEEHPQTADFHGYYAHTLARIGRAEEAVAYATRSVELLRPTGNAPNLADALIALAAAEQAAGRPDEAVAPTREARRLLSEALGEGHPQTAWARQELAAALLGTGRTEEAATELGPALEVLKASRTEPRWLYDALVTRARIELARGRTGEARGILERVLEDGARELPEGSPTLIAARAALEELEPED